MEKQESQGILELEPWILPVLKRRTNNGNWTIR